MQTGKASSSNVARPSNIEVRVPTQDDIEELAHTMRPEDVSEIWHLARLTPREALDLSTRHCSYNRAVLLDGRVVAMFGVGGVDRVGVPWMLASPLLTKIRKQFLRESKDFLEEMSRDYNRLQNVAWLKNKEHIRWLTWLGFTMLPPQPRGPDGELYIDFYKVV